MTDVPLRILVTGMTATQCNSGKYGICTLTERAAAVLADSPNTIVEWRGVEAGEDLSHFDVAFIGIYEPRGTTSGFYKYGALWAMSQLPHVALYDDWQVRMITRTWDYALTREHGEDFWRLGLHVTSKRVVEERRRALKHRELIDETWKNFAKNGAVHSLAPLFEWGSGEALVRATGLKVPSHGKLHIWDPTPACRAIYGVSVDDQTPHIHKQKLRQHFLAALRDHSAWVERQIPRPEWPVIQQTPLKSKKTGATGGSTLGKSWNSMTEMAVVKAYQNSCSAVSPPYAGFEGVGWWRNRVRFAIDAGAAVVGTEQEYPHGFAASFSDVEADPYGVWLRQVKFIEDHTDSYESAQLALFRIMESAMSNPKGFDKSYEVKTPASN